MANQSSSALKIALGSLILVGIVFATMYFLKDSKGSKKSTHRHGSGEYHSH
jgi:hypothetical protein